MFKLQIADGDDVTRMIQKKSNWIRNSIAQFSNKTPCILINPAEAVQNYNEMHSTLSDYFSDPGIYYAVKANQNEDLIKSLAYAGSNFLVADAKSLQNVVSILRKQSIRTHAKIRMLMSCFQEKDIFIAEKSGAGFVADSFEQAKLLSKLTNIKNNPENKSEIKSEILCRLSPGNMAKNSPYRSHESLGMDEKELLCSMRFLQNSGCRTGIHCHSFSQATDLRLWKNHFKTIQSAAKSAKVQDIEINAIDFGGGFPVEYESNIKSDIEPDAEFNAGSLSLKSILHHNSKIIGQMKKEFPNAEFSFEPGRSIAAGAGAIISKIIGVKKSHGKTVVITDFSCYSGWLDAMIAGITLPLFVCDNNGRISYMAAYGKKTKYIIRGSTIDSLDVLNADAKIPIPKKGQIIVFYNAGAYSFASEFGPEAKRYLI